MPDLFGISPLPGFASLSDIVSSAEAAALVDRIDRTALSPFRFQGWLGKRLTASYGSGYDFDMGKLVVAEPIPDWLHSLRERAAHFSRLDPDTLTQVLLTRYDPGAGIGWHRDRPFYEHVVGISLGAPATMRFRRRSGTTFERISVALAPRAAYHLSGEARHCWEHSIAEMTVTRWSITFRSLSISGLEALGRVLKQTREQP